MSNTLTNHLPISKVYQFRNSRVGADSNVFNTYMNKCGYLDTIDLVDMDTHIGIEVEVERIFREGSISDFVDTKYDTVHYVWNNVSDGSLRNNGREFVSMPLKGREIGFALKRLNDTLYNDKQCIGHEFTDRTSVHVHMNIRDLTVNQLSNLVMLYALVEPLLFSIESTNRDKSIFCVPWNESNVIPQLRSLMDTTVSDKSRLLSLSNWYKYTGLNLKPVVSYGTVEFRHMKGTCDTKILTSWINIILSLKKYAVNSEFTVLKDKLLNLNTTSAYNAIILEIFGKELYENFQTHDLQNILETTSSNLKEMFIPHDFGVGLFKIVEQVHRLVYVKTPMKYVKHMLDAGLYLKMTYEKMDAYASPRKKEYRDFLSALTQELKHYEDKLKGPKLTQKTIASLMEEIKKITRRKERAEKALKNIEDLLEELKNNPYIVRSKTKETPTKKGITPSADDARRLRDFIQREQMLRNLGNNERIVDDNF